MIGSNYTYSGRKYIEEALVMSDNARIGRSVKQSQEWFTGYDHYWVYHNPNPKLRGATKMRLRRNHHIGIGKITPKPPQIDSRYRIFIFERDDSEFSSATQVDEHLKRFGARLTPWRPIN